MNNKVMYFSMFALGAVIGSCVTWKLLNDKYEKRTQEEIESVKKAYENRYSGPQDSDETKSDETSEDDSEEDSDEDDIPIGNRHYSNLVSSYISDEWKREQTMRSEPYVIKPEEYGEFEDYEKIELTYYADGFLADDMFELLEDIDETIGADFASHIGEYEDYVVHIRNDVRKQDFEILESARHFSEFNLSCED